MATASPTVNDPLEEQFSWRDQFKLSRVLIFSIVFIIAGALILAFTPNQVSGDAVSTLTLGDSLPDIAVPTVGWAVMVALLYVGGGIVGLVPNGLLPIPNLERVKVSWLILNGILIIPTVLVLAAAGRNTNMITMLASSFRAATPIVIGAMGNVALQGCPMDESTGRFVERPHGHQNATNIRVNDNGIGLKVWKFSAGNRAALNALPRPIGSVLISHFRLRKPLHADAQTGFVHHHEHGFQATVFLADEIGCGPLIIHHTSGVAVDAHLVFQRAA